MSTKASEAAPLAPALAMAIRQRREELGMTHQKLATAAGFQRTFVTDVERGARSISVGTLVRLARALRLMPSTLLTRAEKLAAEMTDSA